MASDDFDKIREKMRGHMESEFLPLRTPTMNPPTDGRAASALEYIAYHMGKISKSLERIEAKLDAKD